MQTMKIDRWNGNTLRRYHHSGAVAVVSRLADGSRRCSMIPRSMPCISVQVAPEVVLDFLRQARAA